MHAAGCADDDVNAFRKLFNITTGVSSSNTHATFDIHEFPNGDDHFLDLYGQLTSRRQYKRLWLLDGYVQLKLAERKWTLVAKLRTVCNLLLTFCKIAITKAAVLPVPD